MFRKSLIQISFLFAVVVAGSMGILAQSAPISGTVEVQKADGTREPVAGALVECFRSDIKQSQPAAKTNSKGQFSFAGLQLGWTFILSVSGPGIAPNYMPNIRGGQDKILITVQPGDGTKMPEDEVRKAAATPRKAGGGTETPQNAEEMKKAQAEADAKRKEIEERNKKAESVNQIVSAALKAGNEAFAVKNYDLAIAKYDEGIAADPDYVGSAPIFHNNRATALMSRAIDVYNRSVKLTDVSEKVAGLTAARKDLADSAEGFMKSLNVLKNAPAADIVDRANFEATKLNALRGARDTFQMAVRTEQVDPATIEAAKLLIPEYLAVETEAAKKAQANLAFADLYRVVGDSENAIAGYKKILETSPDDADALAGAGLSLVNLGYMNSDKTKLQEGSNMLLRFTSVAPDNHKYKADAVALIETLKKEQNVTPQKAAPAPKKRP
jgi:tetratricopeptide (TPR) repeat protein